MSSGLPEFQKPGGEQHPKPAHLPKRPFFSSGPCVKYPGWSWDVLKNAKLSRSHRSGDGKALLKACLEKTRKLLEIPEDYYIAMVPGSTTGAMEMALWSFLGPRPVDVFAWDVFSNLWSYDIQHQLRLNNVRVFEAPFGFLPDGHQASPDHDQVLAWCGTTAGVWVPDETWLSPRGEGLVLCDVTSAVFATHLPWKRLDVTAFSWQKGLGSEAAHGMLVLSPRAMARLKASTPPWPMPRLFRMTFEGKVLEKLFEGETLNTPSLLCVEDFLAALTWAETLGGLPKLVERSQQNFATLEAWVNATPWVDFVAKDPKTRSKTAVCLQVTDPRFEQLSLVAQYAWLGKLAHLLEQENAGFDIVNHNRMPPSLRIWTGPTVELCDLQDFLPWLGWAFEAMMA
ncbi:MAG: phosphoserine transaminase [Alphaproteobacteria bacterium]